MNPTEMVATLSVLTQSLARNGYKIISATHEAAKRERKKWPKYEKGQKNYKLQKLFRKMNQEISQRKLYILYKSRLWKQTNLFCSQFHFYGKVFYVSWLSTAPWRCGPNFYIFKLDRLSVFYVDFVPPTNDNFEPGPILGDHDVGPLVQFQSWDGFLIIWIFVDMKADLNPWWIGKKCWDSVTTAFFLHVDDAGPVFVIQVGCHDSEVNHPLFGEDWQGGQKVVFFQFKLITMREKDGPRALEYAVKVYNRKGLYCQFSGNCKL